jgi:hypothetical protein
MSRIARTEIFDASEIAVIHYIARVTRRCFLLGKDPYSQKNYAHRKGWIEKVDRCCSNKVMI